MSHTGRGGRGGRVGKGGRSTSDQNEDGAIDSLILESSSQFYHLANRLKANRERVDSAIVEKWKKDLLNISKSLTTIPKRVQAHEQITMDVVKKSIDDFAIENLLPASQAEAAQRRLKNEKSEGESSSGGKLEDIEDLPSIDKYFEDIPYLHEDGSVLMEYMMQENDFLDQDNDESSKFFAPESHNHLEQVSDHRLQHKRLQFGAVKEFSEQFSKNLDSMKYPVMEGVDVEQYIQDVYEKILEEHIERPTKVMKGSSTKNQPSDEEQEIINVLKEANQQDDELMLVEDESDDHRFKCPITMKFMDTPMQNTNPAHPCSHCISAEALHNYHQNSFKCPVGGCSGVWNKSSIAVDERRKKDLEIFLRERNIDANT